MDKEEIKEFFNRLAPQWDADMVRDENKLKQILDYAGIKEGVTVLDVACGTGVLIPDYLQRKAAKITGVDISPAMIQIAEDKFHDSRVQLICGDVENIELSPKYDCCMVYNAFPHFSDQKHLIEVLSEKLKTGGRLTIAHGMSREMLGKHHGGSAKKVSVPLIHEDELAELFAPWFKVDVKISNDEMYVVSGSKVI